MKSQEQINKTVEDTFKVLEHIEDVKVNHFFKHKVLQQLENQNEVTPSVFRWFTPQLQLATLSAILLLNVSALFYAYSSGDSQSNSSLETWAQEYALQSDTTSILN
ncbi:hypothetical protein [Polaribacter sp. R77954]|uniref:hypothetical protein n=1 Tax=Polaribacter sp. R77954 TaxID=3093870 RepID=UPI0037C5FB61